MRSIEKRLQDLEAPLCSGVKPLPVVVADDTTDSELERLRMGGQVVLRFTEFLESCIL